MTWDIAVATVEGARFVTPEEYREGKHPYVFQGLVDSVLTDALAAAADRDGVIADFHLPSFYATYVREALLAEEDDAEFTLTYDRFTAMALMDALHSLLMRGLLAHRGKGDSYDYRLALPAE